MAQFRCLRTGALSLPPCGQRLDGATALLIAAQKGHVECVRELLSPHQHAVTGAQVLDSVIAARLRMQMVGGDGLEHFPYMPI